MLEAGLASGVDALLLACTELPIVVGGSKFEAQSVDATAALAQAIVAFSLDTSARNAATPRTTQLRKTHLGDQVA